ncbi:hypothetical protein C8J57DRAFT_1519073 [Mycena rebaudengoi]|nr:hypothetical protein C8J57DRAFT_1519073 [Mycena rebaudengoi]
MPDIPSQQLRLSANHSELSRTRVSHLPFCPYSRFSHLQLQPRRAAPKLSPISCPRSPSPSPSDTPPPPSADHFIRAILPALPPLLAHTHTHISARGVAELSHIALDIAWFYSPHSILHPISPCSLRLFLIAIPAFPLPVLVQRSIVRREHRRRLLAWPFTAANAYGLCAPLPLPLGAASLVPAVYTSVLTASPVHFFDSHFVHRRDISLPALDLSHPKAHH